MHAEQDPPTPPLIAQHLMFAEGTKLDEELFAFE